MQRWSKLVVAGLVAGSMVLGSLPALARPYSNTINQRQYRQQSRIYQGVASGQITPWECRLLQREQARIRAAEARMKADGRFSKRERARLQHRLNLTSRQIYRAKHNGRVR